MKSTLYRYSDGHYERHYHGCFTWIMVYNADGSYRGQWQDDAFAEIGDPPLIFFTANPPNAGGKMVKPLSWLSRLFARKEAEHD